MSTLKRNNHLPPASQKKIPIPRLQLIKTVLQLIPQLIIGYCFNYIAFPSGYVVEIHTHVTFNYDRVYKIAGAV